MSKIAVIKYEPLLDKKSLEEKVTDFINDKDVINIQWSNSFMTDSRKAIIIYKNI